MELNNENNGQAGTSTADKPGLVDIARNANAAPEVKRGRGRPAGSTKAAPGALPPVVAEQPAFIWNVANAGALTRPLFSVPAFILGIKEIALTPEEEAVLMPAMVPLYQEFFPYMSPRLAAAIGGVATLGPIMAAKVKIYMAATKRERDEAKKAEARKTGNLQPEETTK